MGQAQVRVQVAGAAAQVPLFQRTGGQVQQAHQEQGPGAH
jgi:hypothetical protein